MGIFIYSGHYWLNAFALAMPSNRSYFEMASPKNLKTFGRTGSYFPENMHKND